MAATNVRTIVRLIEAVGTDVKLLTLEDEDGWELPPARPGAHIDLFLPNNLLRTYSLCSGPRHRTRYEVAIKREAGGRGGSIAAHDRVNEGDVVGVSLPRGGLMLDPGMEQIFIAGGIGVTPFLSAADELVARGNHGWTLHVLSRGAPPLAGRLAALSDGGHVVHHDTSAMRPDLRALIGPPRPGMMLSCCGPSGMLDAFDVAAADWPPEQRHVERFVPPVLAPDPNASPYRLVLARADRSMEVPLGMSMTDAIARCGVEVPTSCGGGICGACRVRVLEGKPLHRDRFLSPAEREHDVLACVAGCAGGTLILDL